MKKTLGTMNLLVAFIASILVCGDLLSPWVSVGDTKPSALGLVLFSFFFSLTLLISSLLVFKNPRAKLERKMAGLFQNNPKFFWGFITFLLLVLYEGVQDILFLYSDMALIHYRGYRQILTDYFSILLWTTLVVFLVLLQLIVSRWKQIKLWLEGIGWKKTLIIMLTAVSITLVLNWTRAGYLPQNFDSRWFEEPNAPLMGLQVVGLTLAVFLAEKLGDFLSYQYPQLKKLPLDLLIIVFLFIIAFASWWGKPRTPTTFTDAPRPPNYQYYPLSDALGYQINAQELISGNSVGQLNHVAFWNYLAVVDVLTGDDVQTEYLIWLVLISTIPVFLYVITTHLSNRTAGMLVGLLFIVRENNSMNLLDQLTIPQLRDQMTEPLTIVGLLLAVFLVQKWMDDGREKLVYLLLAGSVLGWIILLRIEAVVYVAAVGLGLLFLMLKSSRNFLRSISALFLGILCVAGPWLLFQVNRTGKLSTLGLGRSHLVTRVFESGSADLSESERNGIRSPAALPYNFGNNLVGLFYYLPQNHQPFLTFKNIPDLILNRADSTDLEGDSYWEKYLERYVRGLPYWWNDWTGRLEPRSFLPLLFSLSLVFGGFSITMRRNWAISIILLLAASFLVVIYTIAGKSGGRFVQVVEWIPLVFFGIGIHGLVSVCLKSVDIEKRRGWAGQKIRTLSQVNERHIDRKMFVFAAIPLILWGMTYPLGEVSVPTRYPTKDMLDFTEEYLPDISNEFPDSSDKSTAEFELIYGKVLYPRYLINGESLGGDNPKMKYSDPSLNRLEFYVVGTDSGWAALPAVEDIDPVPHGSEVIVLGVHESEKLASDGSQIHGPYLKVSAMWILPKGSQQFLPGTLQCLGFNCLVPADAGK